jgi:hypothetical protein
MRSSVRNLMLLAMALAGAVAGSACAHAPSNTANNRTTAPIASGSEQTRVPGEYLITLVAGTDVKVIADSYGRFGVKSIKDLGAGIFQLTLSEDPGPEKMEKLRGQDVRIKAIQPNFVYRANRPAGGAQ